MVIAEIVTLFFYVISMTFLPEYFGTLARFAVSGVLLLMPND